MAACKSVLVVCPNARRQTVKVGPTTTILQILEEVCKKQGYTSQDYAIKHQRKIVDETLPVRYSGLSNNAHLELVPHTKTSSTGACCTVGLQLASGDRLVKEFPPTHSLWDVISHWDTDDESSHKDKMFGEPGQIPVCVYMTQKIMGEASLKKTTLHNLGLSGKRAVIRLLHEVSTEECNDEVAMKTSEDKLLTPQQAKSIAGPPISQESNKTSSQTATTEASQTKTEQIPAITPVPFPVTTTEQILGTVQEPFPSLDSRPVPVNVVGPPGETRQRPLQPGTVSPDRAAKEPKRSRNVGPQPLFPDFKFPEKKESDSRSETTGNDVVTEERKQLLSTPCDRVPLVFSETAVSDTGKSEQDDDLPDSFFEVTVDDLRKMLQDLHSERSKKENAPLMTKSMREARKLSESYKYDKIVIRVKFPDRFTLQGFFRPHEKVSMLTEFVKSCLADPSTPFYLYTAPPKTVLKQDSTLFEADMCPASLVYFGSNIKQEHYMAANFMQNSVTAFEAEQAVFTINGSMTSANESANQTNISNGNTTLTNKSQHEAKSSLPSASQPVRQTKDRAQGAPKWFKGTGK
ncbi:predicted protein [Nematostella vectensis]|uniref:UBX domain-containing protein n=1 Tax=Nematostella vectensis TaxID=45351 RepID=A7RUJ0_NEMVE|nr:predicted protein [Nematostella vectensis]|eukprot:XP_001636925.1 predicted protein [Nematostella vectensis]